MKRVPGRSHLDLCALLFPAAIRRAALSSARALLLNPATAN